MRWLRQVRLSCSTLFPYLQPGAGYYCHCICIFSTQNLPALHYGSHVKLRFFKSKKIT